MRPDDPGPDQAHATDENSKSQAPTSEPIGDDEDDASSQSKPALDAIMNRWRPSDGFDDYARGKPPNPDPTDEDD